jgi:hypothetical protein
MKTEIFETFWKCYHFEFFLNSMKFLKVLKFYENFEFWKKNEIFKFVKKKLNFQFFFFLILWLKFFKNFQILWNFLTYWLSKSNFCAIKNHIALSCHLILYSLILHESAIWLFTAQKLLFANQYVRKWNVTCIASGQ